jgi:lipopolysaccharide/colanic/teichoic acid biosynthesis glycosyltransferase
MDPVDLSSEAFDLKRLLDVAVSIGALVFLSPLLLFVAVAVKLTSPGGVLHLGERVGRGGRPFRIFKYRTMVPGAWKMGPGITARDDPRITRIGRFLRATKLDELPSFINVLRGEMSLVGPRPEDAHWVKLYTEEERRVLLVRPGLTSLASIRYRHEERDLEGKKIEDAYPAIMRHKLRIELEYLRNRSLVADLEILAKTLLAIFQKHSPTR